MMPLNVHCTKVAPRCHATRKPTDNVMNLPGRQALMRTGVDRRNQPLIEGMCIIDTDAPAAAAAPAGVGPFVYAVATVLRSSARAASTITSITSHATT